MYGRLSRRLLLAVQSLQLPHTLSNLDLFSIRKSSLQIKIFFKQSVNYILWLTCFNFKYILKKGLNEPVSIHFAVIFGVCLAVDSCRQ